MQNMQYNMQISDDVNVRVSAPQIMVSLVNTEDRWEWFMIEPRADVKLSIGSE